MKVAFSSLSLSTRTSARNFEYISPLRQIARVISNAPARLQLPAADGGQAYWVAEAALIPETEVNFSVKELVPEKLASAPSAPPV